MSGTPVDNGDEIIIFQKKHKNQESTSTESIDLNDDTKEEDMDNDELKDMGLFDSVFVNVQGNKKIYGALCLFKKRKQLFISYLPMEVRTNASLKSFITRDTTVTNIQDYKITFPFREIIAFSYVQTKTTTTITFEMQQRLAPLKVPQYEFGGKGHKEQYESFFNTISQNSLSEIKKDETHKNRYIVIYKSELKCDIAKYHQKAYSRLINPLLVEKRKTLIAQEHIDTMQPVSKTLLKTLMDDSGYISSSNMNVIRKVLLYRGCDDDVREFVWKLCLGYYEGKNTQKERMEWDEKRAIDYEKIKQTWTNVIPEMKENWDEFAKMEEQIKKDVVRTDREDTKFEKDGCQNLKTLTNVLMSSSMFNMKIGYGQGMNDIVAVLMRITTKEPSLFWLFQSVMTMLQGFYCSNANYLYKLLNKLDPIISLVNPALGKYLKEHDSNNVFAYKWIVLLFKRYISDSYLLRIWDSIFAFPTSKFYYFLVVALIKEYADDIIDNQMDFDDLFVLFQSLGPEIGVDIIFDADLILQEFMHISQPSVLTDFLKNEPIPK
ncbi:hypothetical protein, conserved [Entamoeba dispar SAW760]|uniref:Rab-GAP TBC domain-containing protein n=1 Tax=Entamoeba dispar (strain ATCC PRA-260 / SAW760) TaxID=370354 RepID=B0ER11_ENTDS|nr:uncharacterized protein EDI_123450 [Entamoeba dispar SAW760]EDR23020.1 hypothetical protein, conserved [Entamoeba dispar SAW760]|eukprot:EDR23020.1 hypothetical protein, conserved [Entamoeba dispar SAW760]